MLLWSSHDDETEIESSAEEIDNIIRAQRSASDVCCKEEQASLYKDSVCSTSTSLSNVPSHPPALSLYNHLYPAGACVFSWTAVQESHYVWADPVWQDCEGLAGAKRRTSRKERPEEWRKEREGSSEELTTWGKLMNGRYYMGGGNEREEQLNEGVAGSG